MDYRYTKVKHAERNKWAEWEHREIAAKALGRKLARLEEVHHVNGDGENNRSGNLVICSKAFHKYLHFIQRVHAKGTTRSELIKWHHIDQLPLEEIKRRLNLGEGMIGRWFKRMNIEIRKGVGGKGSILYKSRSEANKPLWVIGNDRGPSA